MPTNLINQSDCWKALENHQQENADVHLRDLFARDPERGKRYSVCSAGIYLDYSKNQITDNTLDLLIELAEACNLNTAITDLFTGQPLNNTENRAALHTALRGTSSVEAGVADQVEQTRKQACDIAKQIRSGNWLSATGKSVRNVVNIGIGGSEFGPRLLVDSLAEWRDCDIGIHFAANIDAAEIFGLFEQLTPEDTLFIVSSKSFSTLETLTCAATAKKWLANAGIQGESAERHFVAITANAEKAIEFGIPDSQVLPIQEWVGGRFSVWSAIGLPAMIAMGPNNFDLFLSGAAAMDEHFRTAPAKQNMPILMALIGIWHNNFRKTSSHAVLPYCHRLQKLPQYLQQLMMESLGKSVSRQGEPLPYTTGTVLWGSAGTNGQHSFHQLLLQGTKQFSTDFIAVARQPGPAIHQENLLANCLAQSRALMLGQTRKDLPGEHDNLIAHKEIPGNRASNTLLLEELSPDSIGALIALYEHIVFVQSVIWDINPFDQWGVELGKKISKQVYKAISTRQPDITLDSSTNELVTKLAKLEAHKSNTSK